MHLQAAPEDGVLRSRFESWRRQTPAHGEAFDRLAKIWDMPELAVVTQELAQRKTSPVVLATWERIRRSPRSLPFAAIAVAATVLLFAAINLSPAVMVRWQADYRTATGSREQITLPDGSHMMLNTASAVSLDFGNGNRAVNLLKGEAFFDVVPDAAHPFVVAARFSEVEVKGTKFSVRTDLEQDLVVLEHGVVEVSHLPERTETAVLDPGETISATAESLSQVRRIDTASSLAWREGRIVFDGQPLSQVIAEIARYYPAPVLIANRAAGKVAVSGNYRLTDPEGTIRSLATAAGATVSRVPGGILILR